MLAMGDGLRKINHAVFSQSYRDQERERDVAVAVIKKNLSKRLGEKERVPKRPFFI